MEVKELKQWAKEKVAGSKKWKVLGAVVLVSIISGLPSSLATDSEGAGALLSLILTFVSEILGFILSVGLVNFMLTFINGKEPEFDAIFSRFKDWKRLITTWFHQYIRVFLWTLCCLVPGIIKGFAYSLVPYILEEDNEMDPKDVLKLSEEMMMGHKMDLFMLNLSFIGWHFLAILTCGILEIWVIPYQEVTVVKFLNDIKENYNKNKKTAEVTKEETPAEEI